MSVTTAGGQRQDLDQVLRTAALTSVFQPLVRLSDSAVVGFEVLSRGPKGHPLESPVALLEAAAAQGRLAELDWAMRACGLRTAMEVSADPRLTWFFNAESETIRAPVPVPVEPLLAEARKRLRVVIEFTERSLTVDPAGLLAAVEQVRSAGWGVALDDVGADPASLALLPLINPDVVKLDMRLVRKHRSRDIAIITNAVRAHCEDTGAVTLAEGIETAGDIVVAMALGAQYGQGWHHGRPATAPEVPDDPSAIGTLPLLAQRPVTDARTPFEVVARTKPTAVTEKRLLRPISRYLEDQVYSMREALLFACFEHERFFTPRISERFEDLATSATFTAALAEGLSAEPAPGVRGTALHGEDPLAREWDVVVVGPHFAGALVARDLGDDGPDDLRRFEYVVTHDREAVLAAARALASWVTPAPVV